MSRRRRERREEGRNRVGAQLGWIKGRGREVEEGKKGGRRRRQNRKGWVRINGGIG